MKKISFTLLLLSFRLTASAQTVNTTDPPAPQVERCLTAVAANYLGGAVTQERQLADHWTVTYGVGAHYSFYSVTGIPIFGTRFINEVDKFFGYPYYTERVVPYVLVELRSYNNLFKRSVRGRSIRANSGSYTALVAEIPFATGDLINVPNLALAYPVGVKYGLRRAVGRHLYAEGSIGGFLKLSRQQVTGVPRLDAAVAWYW